MDFYPMWQALFNKEIEELYNYRFQYTYDTPYKANGDLYTKIVICNTYATYIIDFNVERIHGDTYNPEYILNQKFPICEVLKFNQGKTWNGITEILVFNNSSNAHVSMYKGMKAHCVTGPAKFEMIQDRDGMVRNFDNEYYINGNQYEKLEFERIIKLNTIKKKISSKI